MCGAGAEGEWERQPAVDPTRVYAALARPMPDYAVHNVFERLGAVQKVLLHPDQRYAPAA